MTTPQCLFGLLRLTIKFLFPPTSPFFSAFPPCPFSFLPLFFSPRLLAAGFAQELATQEFLVPD